jgi:hypothetical protein
MTSPGASRRTSQALSRATLDGLLLRVPGDRRALEAALARQGPLRFAADGSRRPASHPVVIELWRITSGAVQFGDVDQHELFERLGSLWGGAIGAVMGASAGKGPIDGFRAGAKAGARRASDWSRAGVRSLASYSELMITVPGVVVEGAETGTRHSFVMSMVTDGTLARWADAALGFGYRKEKGSFAAEPSGRWTVGADRTGHVLTATCRRPRSVAASTDVADLDRIFELPLLGVTPRGRLVRSRLERSFARTGVNVTPVAASLDIASPALALWLAERQTVPPYSKSAPWGALVFSGLEATVSYPSPL